MTDIKQLLSKYIDDIEQTLQSALEPAPPFIGGVIRYHFGWVDESFSPIAGERGKFLRPTLCLLVFEALTLGHKDALPIAATIEMIHNFTLIHDDIEDGDLERRGRPTAWSIWGKPLAINVGDYLYALAFKTLHQLDRTAFSAASIAQVQRCIIDACLELTVGQDADLRFERMADVSADMYLRMIYKKTGALLEASIVSGAMLGTSDKSVINYYRTFAQNIGIGFQVRDDILGIWGDSAKTGKSVDNDLRRKKKTLPIIYMLNAASAGQKESLLTLYNSPDPLSDDQIAFVRTVLESVGARQYAQSMADNYINKAFSALGQIGISNQAHTELEAIAKFLISRSR